MTKGPFTNIFVMFLLDIIVMFLEENFLKILSWIQKVNKKKKSKCLSKRSEIKFVNDP